jgi:hypothetical protein
MAVSGWPFLRIVKPAMESAKVLAICRAGGPPGASFTRRMAVDIDLNWPLGVRSAT